MILKLFFNTIICSFSTIFRLQKYTCFCKQRLFYKFFDFFFTNQSTSMLSLVITRMKYNPAGRSRGEISTLLLRSFWFKDQGAQHIIDFKATDALSSLYGQLVVNGVRIHAGSFLFFCDHSYKEFPYFCPNFIVSQ